MSFDSQKLSHIHDNFATHLSISSPLGDPLGKINKFSYLLDAKHLLALSTPSTDESLQHAIMDDCMEVIHDRFVCPLLEQQFMSKMGPSNLAHHIQQLAESPFTMLVKAAIPFAITSCSSLIDVIQSFCVYD